MKTYKELQDKLNKYIEHHPAMRKTVPQKSLSF